MNILPAGAELFHADGRTDDHHEANNRFSQFCERALNLPFYFRVFSKRWLGLPDVVNLLL
jgi:hypothetical protein